MVSRRSVTLGGIAVVLVVLVLVLAYLLLLPGLAPARVEARLIACRSNLNQLGKGLASYLNSLGDNRYYPWPVGRGARPNAFNGAEWLATLYWDGLVPDPVVFLCPASDDANADGRHLGRARAAPGFGSQTVSYAGLGHDSFPAVAGRPTAIRDDFPPDEPMACDDTQGAINHGSAGPESYHVIFFDSHVEYGKTPPSWPQPPVGKAGTPFARLRN